MFRKFAFSIAAILALSSGAFALDSPGILQDQAYGIGATTTAILLGGPGIVSDAKIAVVSLGQTNIRHCCLWALQDDNAIFTQRAGAVGLCSLLGVQQQGTALGYQFQFVSGWSGPKAQGQGLLVDLSQGITKSEGAGAATASHQFIADSLQTAGSPSGSMSEDQFANVSQDAKILGAPCSGASVAGGMLVTAAQVQADGGWLAQ